MGQLGLEMRPDKLGIMVRIQDGPSIVLQPTGGLEALLAMPALELLGSFVYSDIPTYISMLGKPGHTNVKLHLNPALAAPVHARDLVGVAKAIYPANPAAEMLTGYVSRLFQFLSFYSEIDTASRTFPAISIDDKS